MQAIGHLNDNVTAVEMRHIPLVPRFSERARPLYFHPDYASVAWLDCYLRQRNAKVHSHRSVSRDEVLNNVSIDIDLLNA